MSALAEALTAAQARAIAALEKAYVTGTLTAENLSARLAEIGATDTIDGAHLLAALDVLCEYGSALPAEPRPAPADEPMSDRQRGYLSDLLRTAGHNPEQEITAGLTKEQAAKMIDALKRGTYEPLPF